MGGQRSLGFVFGIALAFGVVLAMMAAFPNFRATRPQQRTQRFTDQPTTSLGVYS